ncbi:hypothetical protein Hanom_Chr07g00679691 [Helianthus anomalus]
MASGAREPKVSKAKGIKTCWFSAQALACLSTFFDSAFLAANPATNPFSLKPTEGETPVRSTQACFPPAQPKTSRSAGRLFLFLFTIHLILCYGFGVLSITLRNLE